MSELPTSNERVSDKRLAELVSHYTNVDKQHNGWWVAVYWSLRELQERRSAVETKAEPSSFREVAVKQVLAAIEAWNKQDGRMCDHDYDLMNDARQELQWILDDHMRGTRSPVEPSRDPSILYHTPDVTKGLSGFCLPRCPACEFLAKASGRQTETIPTNAGPEDPVPLCAHPLAWRRYDGTGKPYCEKCGASENGKPEHE